MFYVALSFSALAIVVGIGGLVRIHIWDTTVTHKTCTVNGVNGPELAGKTLQQWTVHTVNCGVLTITAGNPGYSYSWGQKLADQLSIPAAYRLTLHGWGATKDIAAATPANPSAMPTTGTP